MKALRLLTSSKKPISAVNFFSSFSAANPRFSNSFAAADDDDGQQGSGVYAHKLKFQRPTTIKWLPFRDNFGNSASFIGTVIRPLRVVNTGDGGQFGVHTLLGVKNSPQSDRDFWILLKMWNETAELSWQHLKQNDFIYVSGQLCSHMKDDQNGNSRLWYELKVKELNYVAQHEQGSTFESYEEPPSDEGTSLGGADKYKDRLLLWQMFLRNPYEWWDNRKDKRNAKQPDFKHKDTGDCLWLRPDDPPWIERQLQLLDMKMAEPGHGQHRSRVSKWEYDE